MPYRRKYRRTTAGRRFARRRKAASTLQAAWRARARRKRGNVVTRTAKANRVAIKKLKSSIETKYLTANTCLETNNYTGQLLNNIGIDCIGCPNQLAGINLHLPNTPGTIPAASNATPVVMRPLYCTQGVGEQHRVGEKISMSWINFKGSVIAYPRSLNGVANNGTDWGNRPVQQTFRIVVVLDKNPVGFKPGPYTAYDYNYGCGYPYSMRTLPVGWTLPAGTTKQGQEFLRNLSKAPFGSTGADSSVDPWSSSYYENDYVCSAGNKDARFKVLKTLTLKLAQPAAGGDADPHQSRKNFSLTLKGNYKFHYPSDTSVLPINQEILVFFMSDTEVPIGTADPQAPICTPKIHMQCKVAFKDA